MFVIATASSATFSGSIRIRNLSRTGALIEGAELPKINEKVKLRRGDLSATGNVVWREGKKAGLEFQRPVNVEEWLPAGSKQQQQVDFAFHRLKKADAESPSVKNASKLPPSATSREELEGIADMLDALADILGDDPTIVERYLEKLQVLDVAAQKLRGIGAGMAGHS